jgi:cold shock CspA family protein
MKGRIKKYAVDRGFGFLVVKGREADVHFRVADIPVAHRSLVTEGLWAEFDLGTAPDGREKATNLRLLLDEDLPADTWACLLVDEAGDWSSTEADEDRAIALTFLPSADTLDELVKHHGSLLKKFHASEVASSRAQRFDQMGQIVQGLIETQQAAFAVGRIPAKRWPQVGSTNATLWAAMIARLAAVYLPFIRGRAWVAIEDRIVTPELWNFYRHEIRARFVDACHMLKRPDRTQADTWLQLCIYAKKQGTVTHHEGDVKTKTSSGLTLTYLWDLSADGRDPVPFDHIRCGISLPDFIGNVMVSGSSDDARRWRRQLQDTIREVDLTEFRL